MPYITAGYLAYLESLAGGGASNQNLPPPDLPPMGENPDITSAPFASPGAGGPANMPPYTYPGYNDPYGTASPSAPGSDYWFSQGTPQFTGDPSGAGLAPATLPGGQGNAPGQPAVAPPQWASSGLMGYPPATAVPASGNLPPPPGQGWGGWGQPMGYFGVPNQGPIGAFGVGGQGGSFYGGGIPIAPGAAGGAPSPGAIAYGLGPLPGTPGSFGGGGGGVMPSAQSAIIGFHSPQFQAWMAQNNINPQEMLAALTGSGTGGAGAGTAGAYHSGAGPKGIQ